jgi:predicted RNA-binding protein associated with RNAse of E/G family
MREWDEKYYKDVKAIADKYGKNISHIKNIFLNIISACM